MSTKIRIRERVARTSSKVSALAAWIWMSWVVLSVPCDHGHSGFDSATCTFAFLLLSASTKKADTRSRRVSALKILCWVELDQPETRHEPEFAMRQIMRPRIPRPRMHEAARGCRELKSAITWLERVINLFPVDDQTIHRIAPCDTKCQQQREKRPSIPIPAP